MEHTYGHFLDIESQAQQSPIIVKRTKYGYDVLQTTTPPKFELYKNKISRLPINTIIEKDNEEEDDDGEHDLKTPKWLYYTLTAIFIMYLVYST